MSDLVARLRERVICVPKPGTKPFEPTQPFWVTMDTGPHKAGEEAGLQYLPCYSALAGVSMPLRVQQHVWEGAPLEYEAADEIERLIAERDAALARFALLTTEIARLERQLIAEQDHDELLIKAHERLLQLRPGWPEADHGDRAAIETVTTVPCAGCVLGLPKGEDGMHYNPFNGTPHKCTAVEIVVRA